MRLNEYEWVPIVRRQADTQLVAVLLAAGAIVLLLLLLAAAGRGQRLLDLDQQHREELFSLDVISRPHSECFVVNLDSIQPVGLDKGYQARHIAVLYCAR
eukprot:COSAG06_NODE_40678_length_399_cov_2.246667_2_plen_99_part_01